MGESTVRAFAAEGYAQLQPELRNPSTNKTRAFVTIADVNDERGNNLAKELHPYGTQTREAIQD